jgi:peptide deformylase
MILNIIPNTDPILHTKTERFNFDSPPIDPIELTNNLIETMVHYNGIGLAANQCGIPYQVFVMWSAEPMAIFNPILVDVSSEKVQLEEGCISYPKLALPIKRPKIIKVRYQDYTGEFKTEKYIGMTARVFQHELDHLQGIDYTRRANAIHLERARRQQKNQIRVENRRSGS